MLGEASAIVNDISEYKTSLKLLKKQDLEYLYKQQIRSSEGSMNANWILPTPCPSITSYFCSMDAIQIAKR